MSVIIWTAPVAHLNEDLILKSFPDWNKIYEHYKDKAKYFLRWFKNNIKDKKCLAIVEKREIDKIYYRFVGHTHYELNKYDESDYESDYESENEDELSDSLSCISV